jgi:hypothetical protein
VIEPVIHPDYYTAFITEIGNFYHCAQWQTVMGSCHFCFIIFLAAGCEPALKTGVIKTGNTCLYLRNGSVPVGFPDTVGRGLRKQHLPTWQKQEKSKR